MNMLSKRARTENRATAYYFIVSLIVKLKLFLYLTVPVKYKYVGFNLIIKKFETLVRSNNVFEIVNAKC